MKPITCTIIPRPTDLSRIIQTNATATADDDDDNNIDDENGVSFSVAAGVNDEIISSIIVNNPTGSNVTLCGWMDVNTNGSFDLAERQCNTAINPGTDFSWSVNSTVSQNYFSRFRVCAIASECNTPEGSAKGGEVEDYLTTFNPTVATIGQVKLSLTTAKFILSGLKIDQMESTELRLLLTGFTHN